MDAKRTENGIKLDADLQHRVESFARARGVAPAVVLREAMDEYEAHHNGSGSEAAVAERDETLYDRWNRLGFIGCIKGDADSPTDLSTNPKYMEDFGRD